MSAFSPSLVTERNKFSYRSDPLALGIIGFAASTMLAGAALIAARGDEEAAGPLLSGSVALVLFAAMNAYLLTPCLRTSVLVLLSWIGISGAVLALLPIAEHFMVRPTAIYSIVVGFHGSAQMAVVGMAMLVRLTRSIDFNAGIWLGVAIVFLAPLISGESAVLAATIPTTEGWALAGELVFASWLFAVSLRLVRSSRIGIVIDHKGQQLAALPREENHVHREIDRDGDMIW